MHQGCPILFSVLLVFQHVPSPCVQCPSGMWWKMFIKKTQHKQDLPVCLLGIFLHTWETYANKFYTYALIIINKVGQLPFTVCDLQRVFLLCRQPKLSPLYEETPPGIHYFSAQFVLMECCCLFPLFPFFPCFTCELQDKCMFKYGLKISLSFKLVFKNEMLFFIWRKRIPSSFRYSLIHI